MLEEKHTANSPIPTAQCQSWCRHFVTLGAKKLKILHFLVHKFDFKMCLLSPYSVAKLINANMTRKILLFNSIY